MTKKIFISCEEAALTCDKSQYKEASFWEKAKLNLHILFCALCKQYVKNNRKLTKLLKQTPVKLDAKDKEKLQITLNTALEKQNK